MESQHQIPKIILASQSPRRKELLENAGFSLEVVVSPYEEKDIPGLSPEDLARTHAQGKAKGIEKRYRSAIIIGIDTIVELDGQIIQKPKDEMDARKIISRQQGRTFNVISALAMIDTARERTLVTSEITEVTFNPMDDQEIDWYISTNEWQDKSGAFAIQGYGSRFIKGVKGDFLSVVGIPIQLIYQVLKNWGYTNPSKKDTITPDF